MKKYFNEEILYSIFDKIKNHLDFYFIKEQVLVIRGISLKNFNIVEIF
jgi:hypothetical protein